MRIGLLSDLHCDLAPSRERSWINRYEPLKLERRLEDAARIFMSDRPDLVLLLGDTTELGDRQAFDSVFTRMQGLNRPVMLQFPGNNVGPITVATVAGNHDGGFDFRDAGESALAESARMRAIHFLNANSIDVTGVTILGAGLEPTAPGSSEFRGSLSTPPRDGPLTIVASHFPLISHEAEITAAGFPYSGDLMNREALETQLQHARVPTVVCSGHVHARCSATSGCILQLTVGAMIEPPFDCTIVDIDFPGDDSILVWRRVYRLGNRAAVDPVLAPEDEHWEWRGDHWAIEAGAALEP